MTKLAVICDLDGSLVDCSKRLHYVTNGHHHWDDFFKEIVNDTINEPIRLIVNTFFQNDYNIILCSGRPEKTRNDSQKVLIDNNVNFDRLYMRSDGDTRADHIVKKELLAQIIAEGWDPFLVIDDRQSVVNMWRENGLTCLQCAPDWEKVDSKAILTVMIGPSGAGKSTWLNSNDAVFSFNIKPSDIISSDQIRIDMLGNLADQSRNDDVFDALHQMVKLRLKFGMNAVVDATNIKRKDRIGIASLAEGICKVRYIVINRPIEEKIATGGWRNDVPGLIERHENTFKSNLKDILKGDNLSNVKVYDLRDH